MEKIAKEITMKTLDEVLKSYELSCGKKDCAQCPYNDECLDHFVCECYERMDDTLHYLKEYRKLDSLDAVAFSEDDNPPLTWDELKGMEGKPVWVEVKYHNPEADYKYWTIVKYFDSNEGGDIVFTGTGFYYKDLLGIDWQAYRKERK